jgi:hypothetical protein
MLSPASRWPARDYLAPKEAGFSSQEDDMATLRRGLVDTVKKAAAKVSTRGVQVAAKAGTRGARALVETTAAAVKTVDKLQEKLGRRPRKPSATLHKEPMTATPIVSKDTGTRAPRTSAKARRTATGSTPEAQPVELREVGRKAMPAAAPKRSKQARTAGKQFKVKRGQKHPHSGR